MSFQYSEIICVYRFSEISIGLVAIDDRHKVLWSLNENCIEQARVMVENHSPLLDFAVSNLQFRLKKGNCYDSPKSLVNAAQDDMSLVRFRCPQKVDQRLTEESFQALKAKVFAEVSRTEKVLVVATAR